MDIDRAKQKSLANIDDQLKSQPDEAGYFRQDPLVFSCLARGGKTTVPTSLFDELKAKNYLVMIVSFNVGFGTIRQSHESAEAIMRQIVCQLIDKATFTKD